MKNKRNILVISSFWSGIRDFFLKEKNEFKGMPAFTNTFKKLLISEDIDSIYIVFFGPGIKTEFHVPKQYHKKLKVYGFTYSNIISAFFSMLQLSIRSIQLILSKKIKLIYSHGSVSGLAGIVSLLTGVPNVRRIYGTFLCKELESYKISIFFKHPLEYLAFSLPARAIICTNDGTKGNLVYDKIGHKKTPFYFWLNGIDKTLDTVLPYREVDSKYKIGFKPQLCYIARIDIWKRQHLLINALREAANKGVFYKVVIAGPVINEEYYNTLQEKIKESDLSRHIKIIPGLTKDESLSVIKNADVSVSFYDFSNLGNVFLESLSLGTVMLTQNINNCLSLIDKDVYYNTNPMNAVETADFIETIFSDEEDIRKRSDLAVNFSHKHLLTWNERAEKELRILEL